jgi:hypothetical protein
MTNLPKATYEDRFENCVAVKLHFTRIKPVNAIPIFRPSQEEIDISMTIRFGQEQSMEIPAIFPFFPLFDGRVYFGIRRGTLELTLKNCRLPLENVFLAQSFQFSLEVERQNEISREGQVGAQPTLKVTNQRIRQNQEFMLADTTSGGRNISKVDFC